MFSCSIGILYSKEPTCVYVGRQEWRKVQTGLAMEARRYWQIPYNLTTLEACIPLGPSTISKLTGWPSVSDLKPFS